MGIKAILNNKDIEIKKVYKEAENSILLLLSNEFGEYNISVNCPERGYDEVVVHDNDRWIRFYLSKLSFQNGSYVKIGSKGSGDFKKAEIKKIVERINKLF